MCSGHGRLCVCLSLATFSQYCTDPDVTSGNGRGCPLVVLYWANLQLVHGFCCYDNSTECKMSVSVCTCSMPRSFFCVIAAHELLCK